MPRSRSLTRLTMRVGLLHLGQSVDFVVSITFLRSPVFAILAICGVVLLVVSVSAHIRLGGRLQRRGYWLALWRSEAAEGSGARWFNFTSECRLAAVRLGPAMFIAPG